MNINNNATNVKRELLVRIAKLQLAGELDSRKINKIPIEMRPAGTPPIGCCTYHDRELLRMRILARMGISVENYNDFSEAVKSGKTKKTWHTILDGRERESHRLVDGETIPIDQYFLVGSSYMRFPRDDSLGADAKEIIHCRCHLSFS